MATQLYVENNFLIAQDVDTRNIYIKISSMNAFHLRDSEGNFAFFSNVAFPGVSGVSYIQLGAMQDWSFLPPSEPVVRTRATVYPFSEIVKKDGTPYASADELDSYLNESLGDTSSPSGSYLTEVTHDSTLVGTGTKDSPLGVTTGGHHEFVETWNLLPNTLEQEWEVVTLPELPILKTCSLMIRVSAQNVNIGARATGSTLNRILTIDGESSVTFDVSSDINGTVEIYTDNRAKTEFYLASYNI